MKLRGACAACWKQQLPGATGCTRLGPKHTVCCLRRMLSAVFDCLVVRPPSKQCHRGCCALFPAAAPLAHLLSACSLVR